MKVIIAIDNSKPSHTLINDVATRQWNGDDQFMVLHVVSLPDPNHWPEYGLSVWSDLKQKMMLDASELVDGKLAYLKANMKDSHTFTAKVVEGHVCDAIVEEAKLWHADLITIAARGHSAMERWVLGSVADGVLKQAPCSVEIFKSKATQKQSRSHPDRALEAV